MATQNRNRNDNVNLECRGLKMTITEFARLSGINRATIENRLKRGWSVEDAIYNAPRYNGKK